MDETELTQDEVNDLPGDERDTGWGRRVISPRRAREPRVALRHVAPLLRVDAQPCWQPAAAHNRPLGEKVPVCRARTQLAGSKLNGTSQVSALQYDRASQNPRRTGTASDNPDTPNPYERRKPSSSARTNAAEGGYCSASGERVGHKT
jgi:hypothetical protein